MKIVFEMADVDYENKDFLLQALDFEKAFFFNDIMENCVPLPKGHGRLVDMSEVLIKLMQFYDGDKTIGQCLDEVNTIIEADRSESEE